MDNRLQPELAQLKQNADKGPIVLLDYETNADIENLTKPLSHASLIKRYLEAQWPA